MNGKHPPAPFKGGINKVVICQNPHLKGAGGMFPTVKSMSDNKNQK